MEAKKFFKSQVDLAIHVNSCIDAYFNNEIAEIQMIELVKMAIKNNNDKVYKADGGMTTAFAQKCGKRRLNIIEKIIGNNFNA